MKSAAHTEKDDVMLTCSGCGQSFPSDGLYAHVHGGCPCDEDYSNGIPTLTVGSDREHG